MQRDPSNMGRRRNQAAGLVRMWLISAFVVNFVCGSAMSLAAPPADTRKVARTVAVRLATGEERQGQLQGLDHKEIRLEGQQSAIPLSAVEVISRPTAARPGPLELPIVFLTSGDWIHARPTLMDDVHLTVEWTALDDIPPWKIPLEAVRGVLLSTPSSGSPRDQSWRAILDGEPRGDVVSLLNGDRSLGEFVSLGEGSLELKNGKETSRIPLTTISILASSQDLLAMPDLTATRQILQLTDGSRLRLAECRLDGDLLHTRTLEGQERSWPLLAVRSLRPVGGDVLYLSDLSPQAYEHRPFVGLSWPLRRDRGCTGAELRLNDETCVKGLAMHATSQVTYRFLAQWRQFRSRIGLAETAKQQGSVVFVVELDGNEAYRSKLLSGDAPPLEIPPVDLGTARELTLRVEHATRGDILDHAVWAEARLIR